jgi:polyphosphate glucokinase
VEAFGIDIGGSGVKGAPVDLESGALIVERHRIPTPETRSPVDIIDTVQQVVRHHDWNGPIGVTVPGIVVDGVVRSAANISAEWIDYPARQELERVLRVPVSVLNDADAAGLAEAHYGAGKGVRGVVMLFTFGTGIGSALLNGGVLAPNTELGHLQFKGSVAEHYAASRLVEDGGMDLATWAHRADEFLLHIEMLFSPGLIIFGGGISKRFDEFRHLLSTQTPVVPAVLLNDAGIVGAAMTSEGGVR